MVMTFVVCGSIQWCSTFSWCIYRIYLEHPGLPVLHDINHLTSLTIMQCVCTEAKVKLYLYYSWHHAMKLYAGAKHNSKLQVVLRWDLHTIQNLVHGHTVSPKGLFHKSTPSHPHNLALSDMSIHFEGQVDCLVWKAWGITRLKYKSVPIVFL